MLPGTLNHSNPSGIAKKTIKELEAKIPPAEE